jgi:microcystin-dependent protein
VPTGVITLWFGSLVTIPAGWALCDGGNGTPDLRNRFIVGAGSTYAVNAVGGNADAVVVDHTHSATSVVSDPGHAHSYTAPSGTDNSGISGSSVVDSTVSATTGTAVTGITVTTTVANAGSSGTNANLPPYYALAYIMKL